MIKSPTTDPAIKAPASDRLSKRPTVMDFRPSKSLAAGVKRIGGRSGISRLGASADRSGVTYTKGGS